MSQSEELHTTRQHGSLQDALKKGGKVTQVLKHESNVNYNVYVMTDDDTEMVFTNVSPEHIREYSKWCTSLAKASRGQDVQEGHGTKFLELMKQPGAKISDWHPTQRETYSVHVQTKDGEKHVYTSISEAHMQEYCEGFEPGSSKEP